MQNLSLTELQPLILEWAKERNILFQENAPKQRLKLIEECGELASAILKNDVKLQKDAIGDIFVVLTIFSEQIDEDFIILDAESKRDLFEAICKLMLLTNESPFFTVISIYLNRICKDLNLDLTECANIAWNEIKDRKGKTVNGTFIKD